MLLALPLPVGVGVHAWYALAPVAPVSSEAMAQSLAVVRSQLAGGAVPAAPALDGVDQQIGPVHATLWREGRAVARARGDGARLSDAVRQAGGRLAAELRTRGERPEGRLKLDRVVARGPVPRWRPLLGLSLDPGLDGLQAGDDPSGATVLPDDLLAAAVAGAAAPLPQLDELRLGVDGALAGTAAGGSRPVRPAAALAPGELDRGPAAGRPRPARVSRSGAGSAPAGADRGHAGR